MREKKKRSNRYGGRQRDRDSYKEMDTEKPDNVSFETRGPGQSGFVLEEQFTDHLWVPKCLDSTY